MRSCHCLMVSCKAADMEDCRPQHGKFHYSKLLVARSVNMWVEFTNGICSKITVLCLNQCPSSLSILIIPTMLINLTYDPFSWQAPPFLTHIRVARIPKGHHHMIKRALDGIMYSGGIECIKEHFRGAGLQIEIITGLIPVWSRFSPRNSPSSSTFSKTLLEYYHG